MDSSNVLPVLHLQNRVLISDHVRNSDPISEQDYGLLLFRVPVVTADGTCSMPDRLQPEPHDTMASFAGATLVNGRSAKASGEFQARRVRAMRDICQAIADKTGSQWVGIYERVTLADGQDVLAKLQYIGAFSRAHFPLTPEFAAHSNNSTVGLTGRAICISDTVSMGDVPYYTCDGRVRAEFCAPILNQSAAVVGIIDAESFTPGVYGEDARALILDVCAQLGESDMLRALLQC